ncbi:hypothetical protein ACG74X_19010 [Marivita sp. S0852]|uniref:hypothetical protein n=1 Tax=Marivita sp. S0852 TaxID=3373893 RepID=UPI003982976A
MNVLYRCLGSEANFENRAWLISAVGKLASQSSVRNICEAAGIDYLKEYELAARLFSDQRFESLGSKFIDIETDTNHALLWLSLSEGYEKAPENITHASFENVEVVRQLNAHHDPKVAEYSVWSLWQHPDRTAKDLFIEEQKYSEQPEGVRRWIYRLHAKSPLELLKRTDFLQSFYQDSSRNAREGLALGLRGVQVWTAQNDMVKWFTNEEDEVISHLLYEHMARNCEGEERFEALVVSKYKEEASDGPFRNRMLAAASGTPLLNKLRIIDLDDSASKLRSDLGEPTKQLFSTGGSPKMVNVYGNVGNLSLGDQKIKAEKLVQEFSTSGISGETIAEILSVAGENLDKTESESLANEMNQLAENSNQETAASLKDRLTKLAGTVTAGSKAAAAIDKFLEVVNGIAG